MNDSICNLDDIVELDKRELLKISSQLHEIVQVIYRLKGDAMSVDQYHDTLTRLQKRAIVASQRLGELVGKHTNAFDRMTSGDEKYGRFDQ